MSPLGTLARVDKWKGTIGDMDTNELQRIIKDLINHLGWSQKRLAREVYVASFDYDDLDEIKRHEEKIKKDLSRSTTKAERLLRYLEAIRNHDEFKKLNIAMPIYYPTGRLSENITEKMASFSERLSNELEENGYNK